MSIDPMGNKTTEWSTALGLPSCTADSTAASACTQGQAGPPPVDPGTVITPPPTAPPSGVTYNLYDKNGNPLYSETAAYQPGSSSPSAVQTEYTLYKNNSVTLNGTSITCTATPPSPSLPCATIDSSGDVTQLAYDPQPATWSPACPRWQWLRDGQDHLHL